MILKYVYWENSLLELDWKARFTAKRLAMRCNLFACPVLCSVATLAYCVLVVNRLLASIFTMTQVKAGQGCLSPSREYLRRDLPSIETGMSSTQPPYCPRICMRTRHKDRNKAQPVPDDPLY
jgi:hypothetical protein